MLMLVMYMGGRILLIKSVTLSEVQKGIYFECHTQESLAYNISTAVNLTGINMEQLKIAMDLLIAEQGALRSCIKMEDSVPVMQTYDSIMFELEVVDCRSKSKEEISRCTEQIRFQQFDLEKAPLFDAKLLQIDEEHQILVLCMHHLISDGVSMGLFLERLFYFYDKLEKGEAFNFHQDDEFSKFIEKENDKLINHKYDKAKDFWTERVNGAEPLELYQDYSANMEKSGIGREKKFSISNELFDKASELGMNNETSAFNVFLASFAVLMKKYVQKDELTIASPFTHRPSFDLEKTIGCFIYTLPLKFQIDKDMTFIDVLNQTTAMVKESYKYLGYPNNLMVRDTNAITLPGVPSIFDVSFIYDYYDEDQFKNIDSIIEDSKVTFPGNMMVILQKLQNEASIKFQYKSEMYSEETIEHMGQRFVKLLQAIVEDGNRKVQSINLLLDGEKEKLLYGFNESSFFPYEPSCPVWLFEKNVAQNPGGTKLIYSDGQLTNVEVNERANQLARKICSLKKKENDVIGLQMKRCKELVIAVLAILKAGCAYVPIDEQYPDSRKLFIAEDADISIWITQKSLSLPEELKADVIYVDDDAVFTGETSNLDIELSPQALAYIEYTSGSTGTPKGVMIENHTIVNTILDLHRRFPLEAGDVYMFKTPYTFDISGTEIYGWFAGKGDLYILDAEAEKDPLAIIDAIEKYKVTHINFVPSMFHVMLDVLEDEELLEKCQSLKWFFVGGEAITPEIIDKFLALETDIKLENVYGPTECTMWATHYPIRNKVDTVNVPIGKPLNEYRIYIVDENNEIQPIGIPGEICISGPCLARGYLNRGELTSKVFVDNPFYDKERDPEWFQKMYRTGDLGRWIYDGTVEFLGRIDFQVKINGVRIELGEIDNALGSYPNIVQSVAVLKEVQGGSPVICAYYLSENEIPEMQLRDYLREKVPPYLIPAYFAHKTEFPQTGSGKIDRKALQADTSYIKEVENVYVAPKTDLEQTIAKVWKEVIQHGQVGLDDNFFQIGGHSLALMQVHNRLRKELNKNFPINVLLRFPTIRLLAEYLSKEDFDEVKKPVRKRKRNIQQSDIAIVGMAVDVPGARNLDEFWNNLKDGKESIHFYSDEELTELGISQELIHNNQYIKAKGRLEDVELFDSTLFGVSPREVEMTSAQLRILYKGMWEVLEDSGYNAEELKDRVGVFLGGSDDFQWYRSTLFQGKNYSDTYQSYTLSTNHFLATRLSYKFNLRGPAMNVLTGCSTSLVTVHLACQSLMLDECDMAVAGGITIELPNDGGYLYEEGMMFSPDGHCRPFDADAHGTVFSNGMGLVALKKLDKAIEDGDHIYAVIKSSALNNDGNQKMSFTAPSEDGQVEVIKQAYEQAGINPETIGYVEAHGTGTLLGDPIEVGSLTRAFETDKKQYCVLGSVKGNIGHTDTAAGVIGLIKVGLSIHNKYIPATINFNNPNPKIDFEHTPFKVSAQGVEWKRMEENTPIRAGINSFGVGGTNAHMVLEEAPSKKESSEEKAYNLFTFSAKSENALDNTAKAVINYVAEHKKLNLSDVAWTLQKGRQELTYRKSIVLSKENRYKVEELMELIEDTPAVLAPKGGRKAYFLFSGQGSQYQNMGKDLYFGGEDDNLCKIYRKYIDQVFNCLEGEEREEFYQVLFGDKEPEKINQTKYSQFALFATEYAMASLLIELGVQPKVLLGHSIGEVVAAAIAKVWSLEDAVKIVRARGELMQLQEPGVMYAVVDVAENIQKLLIEDTWLSLCNTTGRCVVGGKATAMEKMVRILDEKGIKTSHVKTSHAFHTPMMDQAAVEFEKVLASVEMHEPEYDIISNVTGEVLTSQEIMKPSYWSSHIMNTVQFEKDLTWVLQDETGVYLEVGPGRTLCSFATMHKDKKEEQIFINFIRHIKEAQNDLDYLYAKLGKLWSAGIAINWNDIEKDHTRNKLSLPTYVFDEEKYPIKLKPIEAGSEEAEEENAERENDAVEEVKLEVLNDENMVEEYVIDAYKEVFGFKNLAATQDFFDVGGDSLKAASLAAVIRNRLGIKVDVSQIFAHTTPRKLARYIQKENENLAISRKNESRIVPTKKADYYPLSSAQRRMYTFYLMDKDTVAYNLPSVTIMQGAISKERMVEAFRKVMMRHESLRTTFAFHDGEAVQIVHDEFEVPLAFSEKMNLGTEDIPQLLRKFVKPFDLENGPLVRMELVKIEDNKYFFLFDIHHIIADGTAVELITRDFNQFYVGEMEPLEVQYRDYAIWQNNYLNSEEIKKQKAYWIESLSGKLPVLEMPTDYERPAVRDFSGGRVEFSLDEELSKAVSSLSRKFGATNFMIMLSAWNILIAKYSGQEDIIVGTPVSGRTRDEIRDTVGMFINMLAVRTYPNKNKKYSEYMEEVKECVLKALQNQDYQFDTLVEQLNVERSLNRNAIFDVSFDYHNMEVYDIEMEGIKLESCEIPPETVDLDLILTCTEEKSGQINCFIDYSTSLFEPYTINRMIKQFKLILEQIVAENDVTLRDINILCEDDKNIIFSQTEKNKVVIDEEIIISELFEQYAASKKDEVALILSDGLELTYQQLNERANVLAWKLIEHGVCENQLVGIVPNRDENLFISMLAVLKAGGAYVPIDPQYPDSRISYMLENAEISVLLSAKEYKDRIDFNGTSMVPEEIDYTEGNKENPPRRANRESTAYVIFTSGSTGQPKGVCVKQEGVINLIADMVHRKVFEEEGRMLCTATPSFDIFLVESIIPLCAGNAVYLTSTEEQLDAALISEKILKYQLTHLQSPVSRLRAFCENPAFYDAMKQLKVIIGGGENYPVPLMKMLQRETDAKLYNMYGPTETTVTATVKDLTNAETITIGEPIVNTQIYVVNEDYDILPVGVYGEICITGRCLSKGYIKREEENAARFIKLEGADGVLVYRTGDKGRMLANGEIQLTGRMDSQVKIRGYRVELDEIEKAVLKDDRILYVAAKAFKNNLGNTTLALFYTTGTDVADQEKLNREIKQLLEQQLPSYMVPAFIIQVDELPVLPSGKVGKKALELPKQYEEEKQQKEVLPNTRIEKEIIAIWKEILNVPKVSIRDNFFDIGGNSYGLMLVSNKINELLGYSVPLMQLFENPTIESLAKSLNLSQDDSLMTEIHEEKATGSQSQDIAVIGMAGRFPGAENVEELWDNIVNGVEAIKSFTKEELEASGISAEDYNNPDYVNAKGYLEGVDYFAPDFFQYSKKEANMMDPQIRLLHMVVWNALEDAGYNSFEYPGKIGLFAGCGSNLSWMAKFLGRRNDTVGAFEAMTMNDKDFITTKVSYKLNLKGPSINVQTACSTSLVAIHQAVKYLQSKESDIAVAGGVSISYPRKEGYLWNEGMIYSKDGHCRPFSDDSTGTVSGNGCGVVVLKLLDRAVEDGDHIYAVIKGSAINNDGIEKIGFTAPSIKGERDVIERALEQAAVMPEDIQYVEAHGTGTALGDPIEIEALKQAWKTTKKGYCGIGSVKANIGHLDAASGVTGFINAVSVLQHKTLPPLINFSKPNERIQMDSTPFYITTKAKKIEEEIAHVAVSSFGIGGTNAHMILEESKQSMQSDHEKPVNLLVFSAKSEESLEKTSERVASFLENRKEINLSDASWTLQVGRGAFDYRKAIVVTSADRSKRKLLDRLANASVMKVSEERMPCRLVFCDDYRSLSIGKDLYGLGEEYTISSIYKKYIDEVFETLTGDECKKLRKAMFDLEFTDEKQSDLAMFAFDYAIMKTLQEIGIRFDAIEGTGVGSILAKSAAGTFQLQNAVSQLRKGIAPQKASSKEELENSITVSIGELEEAAVQNQVVTLGIDQGQSIEALYEFIGRLWTLGMHVHWKAFNNKEARMRVSLPGYVFEKKKFDSDAVLNQILSNQDDESGSANVRIETLEDVEEQLKDIWNEVLGTTEVHSNDDFFMNGGDSLTAILMSSMIHKRIGTTIAVAEVFSNSTFKKIAEWCFAHREEKTFEAIKPVQKQPYYETSSAQKRMYAVDEMIEDALPYNLAAVYEVDGKLNILKLEDTFKKLVERHESFRTSFGLVDGELVQYVHDTVDSPVTVVEVAKDGIEQAIKNSIKPFDLSKAPLLRVNILQVSEEKFYLVIDMHHIISDQSSIAIVMDEFTKLYHGEPLDEIKVQYKDFAAWQNELIASGEIEKQLNYWKNELGTNIQKATIEGDFARTGEESEEGNVVHLKFGEELSCQIRSFVKEHHVTGYMLMMAALNVMLWRTSGEEDLVIGTGIAGRKHVSLKDIVGMFVNTLPIRTVVDEKATVEEFLAYEKEKMLKAFENQDCQYDMLVDALGNNNKATGNPLFDVVINYITMGTEEMKIDDVVLTPWEADHIDAKYDIMFTILEKEEEFALDIEYMTALYKEQNVQLLGERLIRIVQYMVSHSDVLVKEIPMITKEEEDWIINVLNDTESEAPIKKNVVEIFEDVVRRYPDNVAIIWRDQRITYRQLNAKANELAKRIYDKGIRKSDKVAMLLEKGPLQIVSMLAIIKCGAVYIPIDVEYPVDRISYMQGDSGSKLVVTMEKELGSLEEDRDYLVIDDMNASCEADEQEEVSFANTPADLCGDDEIYIIYTSGSTGKPKGAVLRHRGVIRTVRNTNYMQIDETDKMAQMANYTFDASVWEIYSALCNGAALVMIEKSVIIDIPRLAEVFTSEKITLTMFITAVFNMYVDHDVTALRYLKTVYVGGEAMSVKHARKALDFLGEGRLVNLYGPTECSMLATFFPVNEIADNEKSIPIGHALSDTTLYVLDTEGNLLPPNIPGELCIGGCGVAKGYLAREDLTKEKFVDLKFGNHERVYRTGDKVMLSPEGEIIFLGRIDFQVKLRGFRIELGELEERIATMKGIRNVVVVARKDSMDSMYLCAYYTLEDKNNKEITPQYIQNLMRQQVPEYMVPGKLMCMENLPINANGKIDRKALPDILEEENMSSQNVEGAKNKAEQLILDLIHKVLGSNAAGREDDFFQMGGQSIKAIALVQELRKAGIELRVSDVFNNPIPEALAKLPCFAELANEVLVTEKTEEVKEEEGELTLDEDMIELIATGIKEKGDLLEKMLLTCNEKGYFPMSAVQKFHKSSGELDSGFSMYVNGDYDEMSLKRAVASVIEKQQMLHCVQNPNNPYEWIEYEICKKKEMVARCIAYEDISMFTKETQEKLVGETSRAVYLTDFQTGMLPWRVCCLHITATKNLLIWSFDHTCFDGMSSDVIYSGIVNALSGKEIEEEKCYAEYVSLLQEGPQDVTEEAIMETYKLSEWDIANQKLITELKADMTNRTDEVQIELPLQDSSKESIWEYAYESMVKILKGYMEISKVPVGIVEYGRKYSKREFYDCVGEFLDIVPVLSDGEHDEEMVGTINQFGQEHAVNFISLIYDEELAGKYASINQCMAKYFGEGKGQLNMTVFNFQGFVSEEERAIYLEEQRDNDEVTTIGDLFVSAYYTKETLYLTFESRYGFNEEKMLGIAKQITK